MAETLDVSRAQDLIRLGWAVAELRGRVFYRDRDPGVPRLPLPVRTGHALPLADERTAEEQLIEVIRLVPVLAAATDLCFAGGGTALRDGQQQTAVQPCSLADRVAQLAGSVPKDQSAAGWRSDWNAFTEALYQWDAQIQDTLAGRSFGESSSYQLGRGLAECTWSLDPDSGDESSSWAFLFGDERCLAITGLVNRLASVLDALTTQAIKGSLRTWHLVASNEQWRGGSAPIFLRKQALTWRDLLVGGVSPNSLVESKASVLRLATIRPIVRSVWIQCALGALSVAVISVGAWYLSQKHGLPGPLGQVVAGLGALGLTGSALLARAKTAANQLASKVRSAIDTDLAVEAATVAPNPPNDRAVRSQMPGRFAPPGSSSEALTLRDVHRAESVNGAADRRQQAHSIASNPS